MGKGIGCEDSSARFWGSVAHDRSSLEKLPMRWPDGLRFAWLPLPERRFLLFAIVCIIATRLTVIFMTPRTADFLDPPIYQGPGQTVLAGANHYAFSDAPPLGGS